MFCLRASKFLINFVACIECCQFDVVASRSSRSREQNGKLYSLFFIPEQSQNQSLTEKKKIEQNTDTPSLEQKETIITISRDEALKLNERVEFENNNIVGSISLKGASIDDLTFKNYKVDLNNDKKVTLLGPKNINEG